MKLTVHLFGTLRLYLPTGSAFNSCEIEFLEYQNPVVTLEQMLGRLQIPDHNEFIVIVNDQKVVKDDFSNTTLQENDEVVLLPSIKGG
jgi:sulfur carrier protein ThiS